ncbi:MAG: glycosyltransferase [Gemmatimonadota bacterium]|nr:glycosyltransferase [Gemmatimonadota bacterium]
MNETLALVVLALTASIFAFLIPFASHRTYLLLRSRRARPEAREPWPEDHLPRVTVQLPMYNERAVAVRAVDAACALDYPTHLLQIQVLDDSDDATSWLLEERVARWRGRGIDVRHVRRPTREGFKAGALAYGIERADGEFLLVLDADFVPEPGLVRDLLPPFRDEGVGMVQAAWGHLNRERNWLTRAQAYLLDGHFLFEQAGRYRAGRFFNFNGTAGIWRRRCLVAAGGWQSDTLTEDLDVSYRAQMAGWRFVYLDDVVVPAEIPETVAALEVQQRRWAQGGVQTGRKILPRLLRGDFRIGVKVEAVIHLFGHVAHPLTWALALLLFPSAVARRALGLEYLLGVDVLLFTAATVPFVVFYWSAGELRGRPRRGRFREVLRTLALGVGLSAPVSRAVARGLRGARDPFVRTPKRGTDRRDAYRVSAVAFDTRVKLAMASLMTVYLVAAVAGGYWGQLPFIVLFLSGYVGLGVPALRERLVGSKGSTGVEGEDDEKRDPERRADGRRLRPDAGLLVGARAEVAEECEAA